MYLQINHRIRDVCINAENTKKQLEKLFKKKNYHDKTVKKNKNGV